ncbi:MAG: hypothetical protein D6701_06495 [Gemmatimonadetes bacterium]|nr:MAG: hypothetical protein D6701_06495 [Gemmatimonadota bacterium]
MVTLALVAVLTFLAGFLQDTPYNFVNYILFTLLLVTGLHVLRVAAASGQAPTTRALLILTGVSAPLLSISYVGYEWFRLRGNLDAASSIEGFMYLLALGFTLGAAGSLLLLARRPTRL